MKIFNVQMTSVPDVELNLAHVDGLLAANQEQVRDQVVVLPECFAFFGGKDKQQLCLAESQGEGVIQKQLAAMAKRYHICLVGGSIPIVSEDANKFANTCFVYGPNGEQLAEYQKIHLFDVEVGDNTGAYRESDTAKSGDRVVVFEYQGVQIGLAICYDLRFSGLFQKLQTMGAEVILLPSAFTEKTGVAHWQTLLQARAIETQCFISGCNQVGVHQNGRQTYGHSLIVDPWGNVISDAKKQRGLFGAELDFEKLESVRATMPVADHNRFQSRFI